MLTWTLRLLALGLALVAAAAGLAVAALGALHHPRVKPHVVAAALEYGGLTLDFQVLSVSLGDGTIHAEGLVLQQPERFAEHAPHWLSVDALDGTLDVHALLDGRVHVNDLRASGTELHLVRDAETSTLDALFPSDPDEVAAPLEPSKLLGLLRGLGVDVDNATLELRRATVMEVSGSTVISRASLDGLVMTGHLHESTPPDAASSQLDVGLALRSPDGARSRLTLMQTESAERDAEGEPLRPALDLWTELAVGVELTVRDDANLSVALEAWPQPGLVPETDLPLQVALTLGLTFHEDDGRTALDLTMPSVLGGLAQGRVSGEIRDDTPTTLRHANGRLEAGFEELPISLPGVTAEAFRATLTLADATLGPEGVAGAIDLRASLGRAVVEEQWPAGHVRDAQLTLTTRAESLERFDTYALELSAGSLAYRESEGPEGVSVDGEALSLQLSGPTLDTRWVGGEQAPQDAGALPSAAEPRASDVLTVSLARLSLGAGADQVTLMAPMARAEGPGLARAVLTGGALRGELSLDAASLDARAGRDHASTETLRARASLHGLLLDGGGWLGLGGTLDVAVDTDARFASGGTSGDARGLAPRLHLDFGTGEMSGDVPLASLTTRERGEPPLTVRSVALSVRADHLDSLAPPRARGRVHVEGRVGHIATGDMRLALPQVDVDLVGSGGAYTASVDGRVADLETGGESFPGVHPLRVRGSADLRAHTYALDAHVGNPDVDDDAGDPDVTLTLRAGLAEDGRTLQHRIEGSARHLAALVRPHMPPGVELDFDEVRLEGAGTIADALARPARAGQVLPLVVDLGRALRGQQDLTLTLTALRYRTPDGLSVTIPTATLGARAQEREGVTDVTLTSRMPSVSVVSGRDTAEVSDLDGQVALSLPDLDDPSTAHLALDLRARHVGQTFQRGYPMANVRLVAEADTTPISVTLTSLTLSNPAGRSRLELRGAYEGELSEVRAGRQAHAAAAIYGREALALLGTFEQDLSALSGTSFAQRAEGTLRVPMRVESGDLATFRISARMVAEAVSLVDLRVGLAVEQLECDVPIEEVVSVTPAGVTLQPSARTNPLSRSRFPDVQPFLDRDAFISARRIILADQVLGPLAGNLRIEGTTFALDRLQLGYRGGVVTAQLEADIRRGAAYVTMRGNATGVQGRDADDVLDANFALRFAPESLALDGSLQLVRMSRTHLEALLNVLDPYREDTDINTVRALLPFGHPRTLQARIQDGLMDLDLQLGGIAGIASIEAIRAIPIAPLLDDYVAPIVDPLFREPDQDVRVRRNASDGDEPARREDAAREGAQTPSDEDPHDHETPDADD
ncbi:MAG: hypothetical protein R3B40_20415 [Polyangiales bacterium]